MSASEKLKALLHAAETSDRGYDNDIHGEPLLKALPQIVAVVEAAEQVCAGSAQWGIAQPLLDAALAALDEALT